MNQPAPNASESDFFYPSTESVSSVHIPSYDDLYKSSIQNPEGFWAERAEELDWFQKWDKVLDESNPPFL